MSWQYIDKKLREGAYLAIDTTFGAWLIFDPHGECRNTETVNRRSARSVLKRDLVVVSRKINQRCYYYRHKYTMTTPLPCPCCGSDKITVGHLHAFGYGVTCESCGLRTRSFNLGEVKTRNQPAALQARAIEAWNKRAP